MERITAAQVRASMLKNANRNRLLVLLTGLVLGAGLVVLPATAITPTPAPTPPAPAPTLTEGPLYPTPPPPPPPAPTQPAPTPPSPTPPAPPEPTYDPADDSVYTPGENDCGEGGYRIEPGTCEWIDGEASSTPWYVPLPFCTHEGDTQNCYWNAQTQGNGYGDSFVHIDGTVYLLP